MKFCCQGQERSATTIDENACEKKEKDSKGRSEKEKDVTNICG
jgi:hypothetical protein